ncbi:MAG: division/cell wall cluster transcriptional repressor MraZ [Desulfovibrionaceae bacterium]|nr:division/cell wall cluster transcriptional repressor MraZ [Desulfovibrionaceae bacterium]
MGGRYFVNTHYRSLDAKGRIILPPEYREGLAACSQESEEQSFWLTGFYGRLVAYIPAQWETITEQLCKIPFTNVKLSHFKSKVMGLATCLSPDAQGRVRIPQPLVREAGLEKDVVLVGMLDRFEIWDQHRFDEIMTNEDMSEAIAATGLEISL